MKWWSEHEEKKRGRERKGGEKKEEGGKGGEKKEGGEREKKRCFTGNRTQDLSHGSSKLPAGLCCIYTANLDCHELRLASLAAPIACMLHYIH